MRNLGACALFLLISLTSVSCSTANSAGTSRAASIAEALNASAQQCVEQVRGTGVSYESAAACRNLRPLAQQYGALNGWGSEVPAETRLVAERARAYAWMAKAMACSRESMDAIW